ncbi:hypothetical protein [Corynebacterium efficiens YS-314]|uniref:Uncharacterized protein n=1 Tax=Corynebacterium efficiens (strain DSM 44549 / YS-314 / AJ 12310 / JCM 11189 / NBRC 100395) TaxID=196164 RepID=Q8FU03_COREF|nr:hypothetical protein [Corynebacterium efficiens YS-314]
MEMTVARSPCLQGKRATRTIRVVQTPPVVGLPAVLAAGRHGGQETGASRAVDDVVETHGQVDQKIKDG